MGYLENRILISSSYNCSTDFSPKVSVCIVTCNHEKYIGSCIDSILFQECDFEFEIIIGIDKSIDNTRYIVEDFEKKYPKVIRAIYHDKNIGPTQNYILTHLAARGKYIAHLDGDDIAYKDKLKYQVEFLDNNHKHVLVWHRVKVFDDIGNENCSLHSKLKEVLNVEEITFLDLLKYGSLGASSSLMYKKSAGDFLSRINSEALDYYISLNLLKSGLGARIDRILGGYRVNFDQETASKNKFKYFQKSTMRVLYAKHLEEFLIEDKNNKEIIFLNLLFCFFLEIRFLRLSSFYYLSPLFKSFSIRSLMDFPKYLIESLKIRSR